MRVRYRLDKVHTSQPAFYILAFGLLLACAGPEFKAASVTQTGDGGSLGFGGDVTAEGGTHEAQGGATHTVMPCDSPRRQPETYDVELCVPKGTFTMGSDSSYLELSGHVNHNPAHEVTLSTFLIDAYEVTVGRYRVCVEAGACEPPRMISSTGCSYREPAGDTENLPMSCVTAGQASIFCQWDGNRRLPTEAEWERTAAGTNASVYPWGDTFDCSNAVIASLNTCKDEYSTLLPVGSLASGKSAVGAYDMTGNVAEWVSDFSAPYSNAAVKDPHGPSTGTLRVVRGGSYQNAIADGRTFARIAVAGSTLAWIGFRCARSAEN